MDLPYCRFTVFDLAVLSSLRQVLLFSTLAFPPSKPVRHLVFFITSSPLARLSVIPTNLFGVLFPPNFPCLHWNSSLLINAVDSGLESCFWQDLNQFSSTVFSLYVFASMPSSSSFRKPLRKPIFAVYPSFLDEKMSWHYFDWMRTFHTRKF